MKFAENPFSIQNNVTDTIGGVDTAMKKAFDLTTNRLNPSGGIGKLSNLMVGAIGFNNDVDPIDFGIG
jgi:hypothetical protein